jgi:hypothetical protein
MVLFRAYSASGSGWQTKESSAVDMVEEIPLNPRRDTKRPAAIDWSESERQIAKVEEILESREGWERNRDGMF